MAKYKNFQYVAELLTQHFKFTEAQRDAVELTLDVLSDYIQYKRTTQTEISFTMLNVVNDFAIHSILAHIQLVLNTKDYTPRAEIPSETSNFITRIIDKLKPKREEEV